MCGNYTHLKSTYPKAKKEHRCSWCNEKILIGEQHDYTVGIFEGEFSTQRLHNECSQAQRKVPHDDICDGWFPGEFKRGSGELR